MRVLCAAVLALSCWLFAASCVQSPEPPTEPCERPTSSDVGEPTDEAREPIVYARFEPSDFPFVTIVPDDGRGKAGGWQEAKANLGFEEFVIPHLPHIWECSLTIKMPLRTEAAGPIPRSHAAELSAKVVEEVAEAMKNDYGLPRGIFCMKFVAGVKGLFGSKYKALGARITR